MLEQEDALADKRQRGKDFDEEFEFHDAEAPDWGETEDGDARTVDGSDNVEKGGYRNPHSQ